MGWFQNLFSPKPPVVKHPQTPLSPPLSNIKKDNNKKHIEEEKKNEDEDNEDEDNEDEEEQNEKVSESKTDTINTQKDGISKTILSKNSEQIREISAKEAADAERAKRIELEELVATAGREAAAKAAAGAQRKVSERRIQEEKDGDDLPPPPPPPISPPTSPLSSSSSLHIQTPSLNTTEKVPSTPLVASIDQKSTTFSSTTLSTTLKPKIDVTTTPRPASVDPSTLIYSPGAAGGEFERLFEDMDLPGLPRTTTSTTTSTTTGKEGVGNSLLLPDNRKPIDPRKASQQLLLIGLASPELPTVTTNASSSSSSSSSATPAPLTIMNNKSNTIGSASTGVGVKGLSTSSALTTSSSTSAIKGSGTGTVGTTGTVGEGPKFVLNGTLRVIIHRLAKEVQKRTEAIHQLGNEILTLRSELREAKETLEQEQIAMREAEDVLLAETLRDVAPSILESLGGYSRFNGEYNPGMINVNGEEGSKVSTTVTSSTSARDLMNSLRRADPTGEKILPTVVRRLAVVAEKYVEQRRANALLVQEVRALRASSSITTTSSMSKLSSTTTSGKPPLRPLQQGAIQKDNVYLPGSLDGAATSRSMFDDIIDLGNSSRERLSMPITSSTLTFLNRDEEESSQPIDFGSTLRHNTNYTTKEQQTTMSSSSSSSSSSSWNKIRGSVQAAQPLKTSSNFSSLLASGAIGIHPHEPVTAAVHAELMDAHSEALSEMERLKDEAALAYSNVNELRTAHQAVQRTLTQTQAKSESDKREREKLREAIKVQQSLINKLEASIHEERARNDEIISQAEDAKRREEESDRKARTLQLMLDDANEQLHDAIVSSNKHKKRAAALRDEQENEKERDKFKDEQKRYKDDEDDSSRYNDNSRSNRSYPRKTRDDTEAFEKDLQDLHKQVDEQARLLAQARDEIQRNKNREAREARLKEEEEIAKNRGISSSSSSSSLGSPSSDLSRRGLSVFSISKLSTAINKNATQRREDR